ncbi:hypothetical protein E2320_016461 [Naja naja]|nr:hypothetical protein E2320_016461 [Naja naja]
METPGWKSLQFLVIVCWFFVSLESLAEAENVLCYKTFNEISGTCSDLLGDGISQEDCCLNHQFGFQSTENGACQSCREARWSKWTSWSACSVSCTEGVQRRRRVCYGYREGACPTGTREREMKSCLLKECCPTHGNWGSWGPWQQCSHTCSVEGSARQPQQQRSRLCNNPSPSINPPGSPCPGPSQESQSCTGLPFCPRDGNWGGWKPSQPCTVTCGVGQVLQKRLCDNPPPKYGGKNCPGEDVRRQPCTVKVPCPVDGHWEEWAHWMPCSRHSFDTECQEIPASQVRSRKCSGRRNGGKSCDGSRLDNRCGGPGQFGVLGVSVSQPVDLNLKDLVRERVMSGEDGKEKNITFWGNPKPQCKHLEGQLLEVVEETRCQNIDFAELEAINCSTGNSCEP